MIQKQELFGHDQAQESAEFISKCAARAELAMPKLALTLGSGLQSYANKYTRNRKRLVIPTSDIPHFPTSDSHVPGHDGKLIIAPFGDDPSETIAIWAGRIHFYQKLFRRCHEAYKKITDPEIRKAAVVFYIAINRALGIEDILTSSGVGTIHPEKNPVGSIARVSDHILYPDDDFGVPEDERWFGDKKAEDPRYDYKLSDYFYSQANLYSPKVFEMAKEVMRELGLDLHEGVLGWRKGKGYESPATIRKMKQDGVDFPGMSTAPEAQKARTVGYSNKPGGRRFASFSLITNVAQLTHEQELSHNDVTAAGDAAENVFNPFMHELIKRILQTRKELSAV